MFCIVVFFFLFIQLNEAALCCLMSGAQPLSMPLEITLKSLGLDAIKEKDNAKLIEQYELFNIWPVNRKIVRGKVFVNGFLIQKIVIIK